MDRVDLSMISKVVSKIPVEVRLKLWRWIKSVQTQGLEETRKIPGYHDEPLKGQRLGQRSIRLTKAYRAIYTMHFDGSIRVIFIEEVHKHDY